MNDTLLTALYGSCVHNNCIDNVSTVWLCKDPKKSQKLCAQTVVLYTIYLYVIVPFLRTCFPAAVFKYNCDTIVILFLINQYFLHIRIISGFVL